MFNYNFRKVINAKLRLIPFADESSEYTASRRIVVYQRLSHDLQRGDQQGTNFDKFGIKIDHLEEELREKKSDLYLYVA